MAPRTATGVLPAPPLVLIHPADGTDSQERFTGPRSAQHPRFTLHIVGSSVDNVHTLTEAVKAKFVVDGFDVAPSIPVERTYALTWVTHIAVQCATAVSVPVMYQVIEVGFVKE